MMKSSALRGLIPTLTLVVAVLAPAPSSAQPVPGSIVAVAAATEESTHWLESLDAGRYPEAWADTAQIMRAGHSLDEWVREIGAPREKLGKPLIRELKRGDYSTEVPGAPKGEYVTAVYLTQYSHAPPVQETILLMMEDDRWHVAGYGASLAPLPEAQSPEGGTPGHGVEPTTKQ
jgi:hypothetical protein